MGPAKDQTMSVGGSFIGLVENLSSAHTDGFAAVRAKPEFRTKPRQGLEYAIRLMLRLFAAGQGGSRATPA